MPQPRRVRAANWILMATLVAMIGVNVRISEAQSGPDWRWPSRSVQWGFGGSHDGSYETTAQNAINDWHNLTVMSLRKVNSGADMTLEANNFGATGWAGLADVRGTGTGPYDITRCTASLNTHYDKSSAGGFFLFDGPYRRAVWCQEIGHCLGMIWHEPNSCMGVGYYLRNDAGNYVYSNGWAPNGRDRDIINDLHR